MITKAHGRHRRRVDHQPQANFRRHPMFQRARFAYFYLPAVLLLYFALPVSAQVMTVRQTLQNDVSAPLSEMAAVARKAPEADVQKEAEPLRLVPKAVGSNSATGPDPSLQSSAYQPPAELAPTLGLSFDGLGQGF